MAIEKLALSSNHLLSGVGFLHQYSVKETYPLHTHDYYEFFFVIKGHALHIVNDESQLLSTNSFILIRPEDVHYYKAFNQYDFELLSIGFPKSSFVNVCNYLNISPKQINDLKLPPHITIEKGDSGFIKNMILQINEKKTINERKQHFLSVLPYFINLFLTSENGHITNSFLPSWLSAIIKEMSIKENFIIGLPKLLELSNTCHEHLAREFKKHLNLTPTQFINTKRIQYATELILENKCSMTEVCFLCGFNNLSHFYHVFQKQYHCSPKDYLNKNKTQTSSQG